MKERTHGSVTQAPRAPQARRRGFRTSWVTADGMHVACYDLPLDAIPVDFFADPDGSWTYEALTQASGFAAYTGIAIGALAASFNGHPEGAAVVTLNAESRPYIAIVECPIAYTPDVPCDAVLGSSAA